MDFFDEQSESSAVKAEIVQKYFCAWSKVISRNQERIGYIDLFCGPGVYGNNKESTPILLLKEALQNINIAKKLQVIFNDADKDNIERLRASINLLPEIDAILPRISFSSLSVDSAVATHFNNMRLIPAFSFIDPFGYAGITRELIISLTKDKCCDCLFFLNYSRINAGISNPKVPHHIEALFGVGIEVLRSSLLGLTPIQREEKIIEMLSKSFERINGQSAYVLPFRFCRAPGSRGSRTSHYLIFLSKHPLGYKIMKSIMCSAGGTDCDGVGTFEFIPVNNPQLSLLSGYNQTLEQLKDDLYNKYRGKMETVVKIFDQHNYGTPFVLTNYKEALRQLESEKKVRCNPAERVKRKGIITMADDVEVYFT